MSPQPPGRSKTNGTRGREPEERMSAQPKPEPEPRPLSPQEEPDVPEPQPRPHQPEPDRKSHSSRGRPGSAEKEAPDRIVFDESKVTGG